MKAATEVGGDYYDFNVSADGTLTIAIGDATGHGTRAGMMVTATKTLFNVLAQWPDPIKILREISKNLKLIKLHGLYMSLTIAKLKQGKLRIAAAGMPYPLIYRTAEKSVQRVILKGMPLGKFLDFPYQEAQYVLKPGDIVLLMSDGLPDRFNPKGEQFGEGQIEVLFKQVANLSPQEIIAVLKRAADLWGNGKPQHDDLTIVAMKIK